VVVGGETASECDAELEVYAAELEVTLSLGSEFAVRRGEEETLGVAGSGVTIPIAVTIYTGVKFRYFSRSDIV
jgi:hypothetical protein